MNASSGKKERKSLLVLGLSSDSLVEEVHRDCEDR